MTHEEAARILDPETSWDTLREYEDEKARLEACPEAFRVAAKALRDTSWISVADRLPDDDAMVLCIVSGKPRTNITLDEAMEIASYSRTDGWIVDAWPEWEDPTVTY